MFEGLEVRRVESLPPEAGVEATVFGTTRVAVRSWAEHLALGQDSDLTSLGHFSAQGSGRRKGLHLAGVTGPRATYLGFMTDTAGAKSILRGLDKLTTQDLGPDLRLRRTERQLFVTNYGQTPVQWAAASTPIIGHNPIPPGSCTVFDS